MPIAQQAGICHPHETVHLFNAFRFVSLYDFIEQRNAIFFWNAP